MCTLFSLVVFIKGAVDSDRSEVLWSLMADTYVSALVLRSRYTQFLLSLASDILFLFATMYLSVRGRAGLPDELFI